MIQLDMKPYQLPLKHVFTIARSSTAIRDTLIVSLSTNGQTGYGEATANTYYNATIPELTESIESVRNELSLFVFDHPDELIDKLLPRLSIILDQSKFALCAIDLALHDLWGKLRGQSVHRLWGLDSSRSPISNYTIGIDTIPKMVEKMQEVADWPLLKIKLGTDNDLEIVRELRKHSSARFRVDANCGWTPEQTIEYSHELKTLDVEFIEQPLPAEDLAGAEKLFIESALPIIADESCIVESDVANCIERFHGINIKLVKCGGLAPARRMIAEARQFGLEVMAGCMTESTVGISALAQIAPLLDYVDMDGAALLAEDIASGVRVECGVPQYPDRSGSGIVMLN